MLLERHLYIALSLLQVCVTHCRLADVYVKATSDIKRVILRLMEAPIKQLGMNSPELLDFIKTSPKGSETLVMSLPYLSLLIFNIERWLRFAMI